MRSITLILNLVGTRATTCKVTNTEEFNRSVISFRPPAATALSAFQELIFALCAQKRQSVSRPFIGYFESKGSDILGCTSWDTCNAMLDDTPAQLDRASLMPPILEIACFNASSAQNAFQGGASRLELCAHKLLDGVTPSLDTYVNILAEFAKSSKGQPQSDLSLPIPINVMIRPNPSPVFTASPADFDLMKTSIQQFRSASCPPSGFVFGILDSTGNIDRERNKELVELASPLPCTFHRAFDLAAGGQGDAADATAWEAATEVLAAVGFACVLTSGGAGSIQQRAERIRRIIHASKGRVQVIVGGAVRSSNVEQLRQAIEIEDDRVDAWHSSAAVEGGEVDSEGEVIASVGEVTALKKAVINRS